MNRFYIFLAKESNATNFVKSAKTSNFRFQKQIVNEATSTNHQANTDEKNEKNPVTQSLQTGQETEKVEKIPVTTSENQKNQQFTISQNEKRPDATVKSQKSTNKNKSKQKNKVAKVRNLSLILQISFVSLIFFNFFN